MLRVLISLAGDQYKRAAPQLIQRGDRSLAVRDGGQTIQFLYNAYY